MDQILQEEVVESDCEEVDEFHSQFSNSTKESALSVIFHKFEQVIRIVGPFNRSQVLFLVLFQFMILLWCGNTVFMALGTYAPTITCELDDARVLVYDKSNHTEFCDNLNRNKCMETNWTAPFYTLVQEWSLICDKDYIPQMINSIQNLGTIVACLIGGHLSDYFGRKRVFCSAFGFFLIAGISDAFATNWMVFAFCRFIGR